MKKIIQCSLVLIIIFMSLTAQDYKITDFKADSLKTWQVFGSGSLSASSNNRELAYDKNYSKGTTFNLRPEVEFSSLKERKSSITRLSLFGGIYVANSKDESLTSDQKTKDNNWSIEMDFNDTRYIKNKFGIYNHLRLRSRGESRDRTQNSMSYDETTKTKADANTVYDLSNIEYNPGLVYGRIWNVTYSAKATEIINELKKAGCLKRDLNKEEYLKFSQLILERKETLHYDSRIKINEAFKEIIKFLQGLNVIEVNEIDPVIIITDIYEYDLIYDRVPRQNGFSIYATIGYEFADGASDLGTDVDYYLLNSSKKDSLKYARIYDSSNYNYNINDMPISFGIQYSRTPSWNFCYNLYSELTIYKNTEESVEKFKSKNYDYLVSNDPVVSENKLKEKNEGSETAFTLGADFFYQINSRSIFELNNDFRFVNYNVDETTDGIKKNNVSESYYLYIVPSYTYYFTPKFYIKGDMEYHHAKYWRNYDDGDKYGYHYNTFDFSIELGYFL